MFAKTLAPMLARRGVHYGWVMVAVTFMALLCTAAAAGMPGVLIRPLQHEFGWSTADISAGLALRLLLFGLMAPFAGAIQQRYGIRTTFLAALVLIVGGILLATRMTTLWQLWLTYGVMIGIGTGLSTMVMAAAVANRWFTARRGLVMGLLSATSATGQLAFLPVAEWLAEHFGWRYALLPAAGFCLVTAAVMVLLGADHPGALGLPAYGERTVVAPPPRTGGAVARAFTVLALGTGSATFWILFGTFFVCGLSTNGLVQTHFIPLCADFGIAGVVAAGMLAAMGCCDMIGTIGSGYLSDRFDSRKLLFWYYGLRGLSLVLLPFSNFSVVGLSLFTVFYGLDWLATVPPTVRLAAQHFGREDAPIIFGWVFTAHQLGGAAAAFGGGLSRDLLASYIPAFVASGVMCVIAAAAALTIGRAPTSIAATAAAE